MPGYTLNNNPIPSVTQIISAYKPSIDGLLLWAASFGSKEEFQAKRWEGADIGKEVHDLIEWHMKGQSPDPAFMGPEVLQAWCAFCAFAAEHFPRIKRVVGIEQEMIHDQKFYGGTADLIVATDRGVEIWDWKTTRTYDPFSPAHRSQRNSYWLQLSAYSELLHHTHGLTAATGMIVSLGKDTGKPVIYEFLRNELDRGQVIFDSLRFVYQSLAV